MTNSTSETERDGSKKSALTRVIELKRPMLLGVALAAAGILYTSTHASAQTAAAAAKAGAEIAGAIYSKYFAGGECVRHIYNKTYSNWKVVGHGIGLCEPDACSIDARKPGTAFTAIPVYYGSISGSVEIIGPRGEHEMWAVKGRDQCVYLEHSGKTDPIFLNDPANGDIIFDYFE